MSRTPLARKLRREEMPAEEALWNLLRDRQVGGLKFRRQHPVSGRIADFACPAEKLIIELDGKIHESDEAQERDKARTRELEAAGWRVIRFSNVVVLNEVASVREEILRVTGSRLDQ